MITGALDGSFTVDNRLLDIVNISTDENGNLTAELDFQGYKDIAKDFKNFDENVIKGSAGAFGTVAGTAKVIADVIGGDTKLGEAIGSWKANQSGMATGIKRGGDPYVNDVLSKVKEGTATPEEIQKVLEMTGIKGNYNLVYTNEGEFALVEGEIKVVDGFYDKTKGQGYVNLGTGSATDAEKLLLTDGHERAHSYTENDKLADQAALNELNYYNFIAGLTGGVTTGGGKGGFGSSLQTNWNTAGSTTSSVLLKDNNNLASQVNDADKLHSVSAVIIGGIVLYTSIRGASELGETVATYNEGKLDNGLYRTPDGRLLTPEQLKLETLSGLLKSNPATSLIATGAEGLGDNTASWKEGYQGGLYYTDQNGEQRYVAGLAGETVLNTVGTAGGTAYFKTWIKGGGTAISGTAINGNPFKDKSAKEIDRMFRSKGFTPKGSDPVSGKGSYVNEKTGRQYYIDKGGQYKKGYEAPHIDITRPNSTMPKRKYFGVKIKE